MKNIFIAVCFSLAFLATVLGQTTKPKNQSLMSTQTSAQNELKLILEKWMIGREERDKAMLDELTSNEFGCFDANGKSLNKKQFLSQVDAGEIDLPTASISDLKIEINSNNAVITFITKDDTSDRDVDNRTFSEKQKNAQSNWKSLELQFQRREDLISNLYQAIRDAEVQEDEFFGQMASARSQLLNSIMADVAQTDDEKKLVIEADDKLSKVLERLPLLSKNYPQLQSNESYLQLNDELIGVENRIAAARRDYQNDQRSLNEYSNSFDRLTKTVWKKNSGNWQIISETTSRISN